MLLLKEPITAGEPDIPGEPPEAETDLEGKEEQRVRVQDANIGQLHEGQHMELWSILAEFEAQGRFPRNPKVGPVFHRKEVESPFKDENCPPLAAKQQLLNPHQADMLQAEVMRMTDAGNVHLSTSRHYARNFFVREVRVCQDSRALNAQLKDDQGGLGHMGAIHYRTKGAKFVTVIHLASKYMQLPIKAEDKYKTAFRDANGRLYEINVCGFDLKTVPVAFSAFGR